MNRWKSAMSDNPTYEYRLSWESADPWWCNEMEQRHGRDFAWIPIEHWAQVPWEPPVVVVTSDPWQQFNTLSEWARTHYQPIRNVKLERRIVLAPEVGWEAVER